MHILKISNRLYSWLEGCDRYALCNEFGRVLGTFPTRRKARKAQRHLEKIR